jgi:hypothetical protein
MKLLRIEQASDGFHYLIFKTRRGERREYCPDILLDYWRKWIGQDVDPEMMVAV